MGSSDELTTRCDGSPPAVAMANERDSAIAKIAVARDGKTQLASVLPFANNKNMRLPTSASAIEACDAPLDKDLQESNESCEGSSDDGVDSDQNIPASPSSRVGAISRGIDFPNSQNTNPDASLSPSTARRTRTIMTPYQSRVLSKVLDRTAFPSTELRENLARMLEIPTRTVQIWFQNQRQKAKQRAQTAAESMLARRSPTMRHVALMAHSPKGKWTQFHGAYHNLQPGYTPPGLFGCKQRAQVPQSPISTIIPAMLQMDVNGFSPKTPLSPPLSRNISPTPLLKTRLEDAVGPLDLLANAAAGSSPPISAAMDAPMLQANSRQNSGEGKGHHQRNPSIQLAPILAECPAAEQHGKRQRLPSISDALASTPQARFVPQAIRPW